jgi:predicted 2-oxoglutarate/Fe(II)-dependent dioxygenase YbiX
MMPGAAFFRELGFFVLEDFLDQPSCAEIASEIALTASEKGRVGTRPEDGEGRLDETVRKVLRARIPRPVKQTIRDQLDRLTPRLADHFHVSLIGCDGPHFLMYGPGAFYKPHEDADGVALDGPRRAVSIVLLLNARSEHPGPDAYAGGSLTFHGLLKGAPWDRCAFSLDVSPGTLVGFPSNVVHEVGPVTFGHRCTMVAWLTTG